MCARLILSLDSIFLTILFSCSSNADARIRHYVTTWLWDSLDYHRSISLEGGKIDATERVMRYKNNETAEAPRVQEFSRTFLKVDRTGKTKPGFLLFLLHSQREIQCDGLNSSKAVRGMPDSFPFVCFRF